MLPRSLTRHSAKLLLDSCSQAPQALCAGGLSRAALGTRTGPVPGQGRSPGSRYGREAQLPPRASLARPERHVPPEAMATSCPRAVGQGLGSTAPWGRLGTRSLSQVGQHIIAYPSWLTSGHNLSHARW